MLVVQPPPPLPCETEDEIDEAIADTASMQINCSPDWQLGGHTALKGAVLESCWRWRQGEAVWEEFEASLLAAPLSDYAPGLHAMSPIGAPPTASPWASVIIFDWDDTIFPTTALSMSGRLLSYDESLQGVVNDLMPCALAARQALQAATCLGKVVIVTNAIRGWIHDMMARFMPLLEAELAGIPIISARSIYEPQGKADPSLWKPLCFQRIVRCVQSRVGASGIKNFCSVGDSWYERAALFQTAEDFGLSAHIKSLKFLGMPAVDDVARQLDVCARHFDWFIKADATLDLWLSPSGSMEVVTHELLCGLQPQGTWPPAPPDEQRSAEEEEGRFEAYAMADGDAEGACGGNLQSVESFCLPPCPGLPPPPPPPPDTAVQSEDQTFEPFHMNEQLVDGCRSLWEVGSQDYLAVPVQS